MRITYRSKNIKEYWENRWSEIPSDEAMSNLSAYPLKYAQMIVKNKKQTILEAGCGAGRILRFYHQKGYKIFGIDYIKVAIDKLKKTDDTLNVKTADITNLDFKDESFDCILAFGLYHNLESNLTEAVRETFRVLKKNGGSVCASFRADNIQTKLVDWYANKSFKKIKIKKQSKLFHKMNLTKKEFINVFENAGFKVENIYAVENMPFLYKFPFFRAKNHRLFNENKARSEGYRLSMLGNIIQNSLMKFFPDEFCNIFVLIAKKP